MKQIINKKYIFNSNLYLPNLIKLVILIGAIIISNTTSAETGRYRIMFGNDPSTEMTIGFDAYVANTNPVLYYSNTPIDVSNLEVYNSQIPNVINTEYEMQNCFVRLTNLLPGQNYYFVIKDNSSISKVYNFETIANTHTTQLSILGGGDSRNNWAVRAVANKIVSKLQAHAFMFDGDFTDNGDAEEWKRWLDDWQLTISSNNRITPIIPARGNHENNNTQLEYLFDCPPKMYYTNSLGAGLLNIYTLNSEMTFSGASTQTTWLESEFTKNNSIWKFVQYHKPIRPHVSGKVEGAIQYAYWANLFYQYGVDMVLEGDAHTAKTTWPIIPCSGGFNCYEGFKRDDANGTVYLGEGSYASPLRDDDDDKPWTRGSGMFHQFKWLMVNKDSMQIRTVKYNAGTDTDMINELPANNRFTVPENLDVWDMSAENEPIDSVATVYKPTSNIPICNLAIPEDNAMYFNFDNIIIKAQASSNAGIKEVKFYINGVEKGIDSSDPYEQSWQPTSNGIYMISAIAKDVNGLSSVLDFSTISITDKNNMVSSSSIDIASDEYYQKTNGTVTKTHIIKVCDTGVRLQGLRFKNINIPSNAIIESANIVFEPSTGYTDFAVSNFWAEKSANSLPFKGDKYHLSNRAKTDSTVEWNDIPAWFKCETHTSIDLSPIIQELVSLPDWTIESPVSFLISSSSGKRGAKSSSSISSCIIEGDTVRTNPPKLTVQFSVQECLVSTCDDGNPNTINDTYNVYCECVGQLAGCTNVDACNYDSNAEADDNSCTYPASPCNDGDPNTVNDTLDTNCVCIGEDNCPTDIVHSGNLSGGNFTVSNSIKSTAVIDQNQQVVYDAGTYIHLDKGFSADSDKGVFLQAKIGGCSQLREGKEIEQMASIKNFPNPFTGKTTIEFEVQKTSKVSLMVSNISGKVVTTLLSETTRDKGTHQYRFDGDHLAQGIYYCTLIINDKVSTQKMILMK